MILSLLALLAQLWFYVLAFAFDLKLDSLLMDLLKKSIINRFSPDMRILGAFVLLSTKGK